MRGILMKIRHLFIAALFCMTTLIACTPTPHPQVNQNLLEETWMRSVNLNPTLWTRGADRWYFTGEPNATEAYAKIAPTDKAISITAVKVPQFTNVAIHGCFQVQIAGTQERNAVYVLGPNEATRQINVQIQDDTIIVTQAEDDKGQMANLKNVIVRIGVRNLRNLKVSGVVNVEGRMLYSNGLVINANNHGNILLNGNINLAKVTNSGPGWVSIIGAYTPCLYIINSGSGAVNVSGRVGVQTISNLTSGRVSIIGADTRSLVINGCQNSRTFVAGYANLKRLTASGNACVHLYWVNSNDANITLRNNARVGLAGCVANLNLTLAENAHFGGQYLHAENIYVQTRNNSHANIAGSKRIFASVSDTSSIYYFGSPGIMSRNTSGHGSIIPVWNATKLPMPSYAPQFISAVNKPGYK